MADQIADMLTRIRNATRSGRVRVDVPASRLKADIAKILENEVISVDLSRWSYEILGVRYP